MAEEEGLPDKSGVGRKVPYIAQLAGAKNELTFWSDEVGDAGRDSLKSRGWHKLLVSAGIATGVSIAGYQVMKWVGPAVSLAFFVMTLISVSIVNPIISEMRATHRYKWVAFVTFVSYVFQLLSGTFAVTMVAWFLLKPAIDQQYQESIVTVMSASQEKHDLAVAEGALEKERADLLKKRQVSTEGIDRAALAYSQAQDAVAKANASLQEEITRGQGGRRPGVGDAAKALRQALTDAQAAEARAKVALDEARQQASSTIPVPESLVAAYNVQKGRYEAKEQALLDAGPGMIKTFWVLVGMLHTEPAAIFILFGWTMIEAIPVLVHAFAHSNVYERARPGTIQDEMVVRREVRRILAERKRDGTLHATELARTQAQDKAALKTARSGVADLDAARDRNKR